MEVIGFVLGAAGFVFAMSALGKINKLEQHLKEAGVLKEGYKSDRGA